MPTQYDPSSPHSRMLLAQHVLVTLKTADFVEESVLARGVKERVFYREVSNLPGVRVQVFTSMEGPDARATMRSVGLDAIRVLAVYRDSEGKDHPLVTQTRVNRTGTVEDISDRMYQRMRAAYLDALNAPRCERCGAPTFLSKKNNRVCANLCWTRRTQVQNSVGPRRSRRTAAGMSPTRPPPRFA